MNVNWDWLMRYTGLMIESRPPVRLGMTPGEGMENQQREAYVKMLAEMLILRQK